MVSVLKAAPLALAVGLAFASEPAGQPPAATPPPTAPPASAADASKVIVTPSGLTIEDIKVGEGIEVKAGGAVVAHCKGTLDDGKVFYDTRDGGRGGEPIGFPLAEVIKGWQEGIPGMRVGGTRRLVIPPDLAYGVQGRPNIPPNSRLTFVIELVDAMVMEDLVVGSGDTCPRGATVTIHYTGRLEDGTVIDSTAGKEPATYPLKDMIRGWQAGVPGMKIGGKRRLVIPHQLAYGAAGRLPVVPPAARLTFEIELIGFRSR